MVLITALTIPLLLSRAEQTPPVQQKSQTTNKRAGAPPRVPSGGPLTVDGIITLLQGKIAEPRVRQFIDARHLAFTATPENLERLRAAGASEELLKLIGELSPPPLPPPPPPPPPTGTLHLSCAPAECDVRIDGGPDKPTKTGKYDIDNLPFKDYTVDFRKEGYITQSRRVKVTEPPPVEVAVTLEVKAETRAVWGGELYKNCLTAIGGAAGLAELKNMSGTGAASSWDTAGLLSEWNIKTTIAGSVFTYDLGNALSGAFSMSCQGETCGQKNSKSFSFSRKKLNAVEAAALNTNLVQYNRYHLLALMERLGADGHTIMANAAPSGTAGEQHLLVESRDESYDVTLDGSFLPSTVTYRSKDGLASVIITYAQYAKFEKGSVYPKLTSVSLPGEKQHGIRVRYETLTGK